MKKNKKVFIVAEIGNNHEGKFNTAVKLIHKASQANVDAVKFQTFQIENFINPYQKKTFNKYKKFQLSFDEFYKLSKIAKKKNLKFISTPLDIKSAIFLNKIVDIFKISSGDNNYYELIKTVLKFNKKTFISTGMTDDKDLKNLYKYIKKQKFNLSKLTFMHCVSSYPVEDVYANLNNLIYMKNSFKINIGYSDHTIGNEASIAAAAMGACVIEKHFTLDNNFSNFRDHRISLNPVDMKKMVLSIRRVEKLLGNEKKIIQDCEKKIIPYARRSFYYSRNINKDSILEDKDLLLLRPFKKKIIKQNIKGRKLKKSVKLYKEVLEKDFF